jgi:uncharacterized membrane protein YphA (DoxX/SURF4 family)
VKKTTHILSWVLQLIIVVIIAQTLPFKFGGAQQSINLFTELGMEPHGRYITGVLELFACLLLLIPASVSYGAFLTTGLMAGAVLGHLTKLGFGGENGPLGGLAILCFLLSLVILYIRRSQLPIIGRMFSDGQ